MIYVEKSFEFDAAHRLVDHPGKCSNIHGHRYKVVVRCRRVGGGLDTSGMVVDFGVLSEIVGGFLDRCWDHALLLSRLDICVGWGVMKFGDRTYVFEGNPTAENMAIDLWNSVVDVLRLRGVELVEVRVNETPTSVAIYTGV
jgi:6-pyruvoyltetrahydropterin/6-carboxytetrahydropterin synthase